MQNKLWWTIAFRVVGMGWYVALCLVAGVVGGVFLDRWLGTLPWLTLVGLFVGVVAAFYGVYKMVSPLLKEGTKSDKNKHGGPSGQVQ